MTCEKCRRYIEAEDSRKQARRLVMARADRTPEYEIVLCRECAEAVLAFVYRRSADAGGGQAGEAGLDEIWDEIRFR